MTVGVWSAVAECEASRGLGSLRDDKYVGCRKEIGKTTAKKGARCESEQSARKEKRKLGEINCFRSLGAGCMRVLLFVTWMIDGQTHTCDSWTQGRYARFPSFQGWLSLPGTFAMAPHGQ